MAFIIRRIDQGGGWLAPPGWHKSFTRNRAKARRFPTREAAQAETCPDNEIVEEL